MAPSSPFQSLHDRNKGILVLIVPQGQLIEPAASIAAVETDCRVERAMTLKHYTTPATAQLRSRDISAASETGLASVVPAAAYW